MPSASGSGLNSDAIAQNGSKQCAGQAAASAVLNKAVLGSSCCTQVYVDSELPSTAPHSCASSLPCLRQLGNFWGSSNCCAKQPGSSSLNDLHTHARACGQHHPTERYCMWFKGTSPSTCCQIGSTQPAISAVVLPGNTAAGRLCHRICSAACVCSRQLSGSSQAAGAGCKTRSASQRSKYGPRSLRTPRPGTPKGCWSPCGSRSTATARTRPPCARACTRTCCVAGRHSCPPALHDSCSAGSCIGAAMDTEH